MRGFHLLPLAGAAIRSRSPIGPRWTASDGRIFLFDAAGAAPETAPHSEICNLMDRL